MKRFTAFFLVLMMVMSCCISAQAEGEDEIFYFTPTGTNAIDATTDEWFSTPDYRALLALSLILDFIQIEKPNLNLAKSMEHSLYLGKDDTYVRLIFQDGNYCYLLYYSPIEKEAAYFLIDGPAPESVLQLFMSKYCGFGNYYTLDPNDLFE